MSDGCTSGAVRDLGCDLLLRVGDRETSQLCPPARKTALSVCCAATSLRLLTGLLRIKSRGDRWLIRSGQKSDLLRRGGLRG